jgi:hypothetical protein
LQVEWPGGEHQHNSFIAERAENAEKTKESSAIFAFSALEPDFWFPGSSTNS